MNHIKVEKFQHEMNNEMKEKMKELNGLVQRTLVEQLEVDKKID